MSTIYVSSTFTDLRAHRQGAVAGDPPARARGHRDGVLTSPKTHARSTAACATPAACDLYVGLFARRYGFCPPGEQRSITELEFRAARAANIDCLCFLLAEDAPWPDEYVERGAGADSLAALRAELGERYLCGFFSTPDELAAVASAAIVRNLDLGRAPFDAQREHRLIKSWRATNTLPAERVRAAQALVNMGSPRYVAAIKERLLDAGAQQDVAGVARYLDELQRLAASRRELMPIFLDLLEHEDEEKRYFAVFQLGELALRGATLAPAIIDALLARASDPDAERARAGGAHARQADRRSGACGRRPALEQLVKTIRRKCGTGEGVLAGWRGG